MEAVFHNPLNLSDMLNPPSVKREKAFRVKRWFVGDCEKQFY